MKNPDVVREVWDAQSQNPDLRVVLLAPGHIPEQGVLRRDLSTQGRRNTGVFGTVLINPLRKLVAQRPTQIRTAESVACLWTADRLIQGLPPWMFTRDVRSHNGLDLHNYGEQCEDLHRARQLASRSGDERRWYELLPQLEQHGIDRKGDHPDRTRDRMRRAITDLLREDPNRVVIAIAFWPLCESVVGPPNLLGELEAIFCGFDADKGSFRVLGRIAPEFYS